MICRKCSEEEDYIVKFVNVTAMEIFSKVRLLFFSVS